MPTSVRLGPQLQARLKKLAEAQGVSVSELLRRAAARYCEELAATSLALRLADVIGVAHSSDFTAPCLRLGRRSPRPCPCWARPGVDTAGSALALAEPSRPARGDASSAGSGRSLDEQVPDPSHGLGRRVACRLGGSAGVDDRVHPGPGLPRVPPAGGESLHPRPVIRRVSPPGAPGGRLSLSPCCPRAPRRSWTPSSPASLESQDVV